MFRLNCNTGKNRLSDLVTNLFTEPNSYALKKMNLKTSLYKCLSKREETDQFLILAFNKFLTQENKGFCIATNNIGLNAVIPT